MNAIDMRKFTPEEIAHACDLAKGLCIALGILVAGSAVVACIYFIGG
jgi:hypothetical protein